jgi:hypothetical protein
MTPVAPPPQKRLRVAFLLADQFTLSAFAKCRGFAAAGGG